MDNELEKIFLHSGRLSENQSINMNSTGNHNTVLNISTTNMFNCINYIIWNVFTGVITFTTYEKACSKLICGLQWVTVFPWPVCTAEAALFRVRHLWGCPYPGNAGRFITYWYTPSLNTPPKTPTVHCWLMSCTASSPWIIFLKRMFPPLSTLLFCDFTSSVK